MSGQFLLLAVVPSLWYRVSRGLRKTSGVIVFGAGGVSQVVRAGLFTLLSFRRLSGILFLVYVASSCVALHRKLAQPQFLALPLHAGPSPG